MEQKTSSLVQLLALPVRRTLIFSALLITINGDIMKGVECTVPKGIWTALESYRLATEGYSLKNGDVILDPREISVGSLLANFVGLPSTAINDLKWTRGQQYELTEYFNVSSGKLRKQYREAHRGRDHAKMASLRREWKDLQDAKDRVRPFFNDERTTLKRQNVLALVKSPRRADKREEKYRRQLATD